MARTSRDMITDQALISAVQSAKAMSLCMITTSLSTLCIMVQVMHLYLDDAGTRNLNHAPGAVAADGYDWFALGGVLIKQEDEHEARAHHLKFMESWNLDPDVVLLHSADIRNKTGEFTWLAGLIADERARF